MARTRAFRIAAFWAVPFLALGLGWLLRYTYFKVDEFNYRTNRWTDETDVLTRRGWHVVQTRRKLSTDEWMEDHPGEIPQEAKSWVYSHADCPFGSKLNCIVYVREKPLAPEAAIQWMTKYEVRNSANEYVVVVPDPDLRGKSCPD